MHGRANNPENTMPRSAVDGRSMKNFRTGMQLKEQLHVTQCIKKCDLTQMSCNLNFWDSLW